MTNNRLRPFKPRAFDLVRTSPVTSFRAGVPIEIVSKLLTHRSVTTTSEAYVHLGVEDLRAELVRAGVWGDGADQR